MARWRQPGVDEILLAFLLLAAAGSVCSWLSHSQNQNDPLIFKGALLKDCAQWGLVSMSVLYLGGSRATAGSRETA